jgi:hypothetical protein
MKFGKRHINQRIKPEQTEMKLEEQYAQYKDFKSTRFGTTMTVRSEAGLGSHVKTQYSAKGVMQPSKAKESNASSDIAEEFLWCNRYTGTTAASNARDVQHAIIMRRAITTVIGSPSTNGFVSDST